jgi:hypothetical protein
MVVYYGSKIKFQISERYINPHGFSWGRTTAVRRKKNTRDKIVFISICF